MSNEDRVEEEALRMFEETVHNCVTQRAKACLDVVAQFCKSAGYNKLYDRIEQELGYTR